MTAKRKKNQVLLIIGAIIIVGIVWEILYQMQAVARSKEIKITAHRGDSGCCPENTLPAIANAIKKRADFVEIDVRMTRDGKLVLIHDQSTKRTSGIESLVEESSYEELKCLDVGKWCGEEFVGVYIPTLEETLKLCKEKINLNIEIKGDGSDPTIAREVAKVICQNEMQSQCVITSVNYSYLQEIEQLAAEIPTGVILSELESWSTFEEVDFYSVQLSALNRMTVAEIKNSKKAVYAWVANEAEEIRYAIEMQVDNIITDYPAETKEAIRKR